MANFLTGPSQSPPASVTGPSPVTAMKGSGKAAESKASGLGADANKVLVMDGQSAQKLPVVIQGPKPDPGGGPGNVASEDPAFSKTNVITVGQENGPGRQREKKGQTVGRHPSNATIKGPPALGPVARRK